jgi:hypothetical protein
VRHFTLREALDRCNLPYPRHDKLRCPFHTDKTASLHLYEETNSWTCFSCHRNGDGVGLYAALSGQSVNDVLRQLGGAPLLDAPHAPKAQPYKLERNIKARFIEITQKLFDCIAVTFDDSTTGIAFDQAMRMRASDWIDTAWDSIKDLPPYEQETTLTHVALKVEALIESWQLTPANPRSSTSEWDTDTDPTENDSTSSAT